ncbi:molybdate ABC transporter substrate-binding protein [Kushneria phosphatilytica]|uniref:Molybdate ABC transporter substrate-binding protein n=1 Tax=Kushneria phosphatilytica TaxID=657387 RepID=A0A1S1NZ62_9GAMM|nr:molybdate ABC transporter substrate-binding protein [Kushneria phosphatilytica]OHV13806.1 molybdate ABC transporter substrate-binding protein [Kushneria phosphatilytica]QEL10357.1 molybdate ABC transporter substrate-binding protein [Kushneria phosphatilytica]
MPEPGPTACKRILLGAALMTASLLATTAQAGQQIHVYAAASLTDAMDALASRYEKRHENIDIVPVYASSSTVARQIAHGAPADIYFSANEKWMNWLSEQGVPLSDRADLLNNRLALIAPKDSEVAPFTPDARHPLAVKLHDGDRLAVGDPDHVPAGIYAKQSLKSLGEWEALMPRLARANDVRAALALVERGEVPMGIVYATDAQASDGVKTLGYFPADSHSSITYPVALVGEHSDDAARAFRQWLAGSDAATIFKRFGFQPVAPSGS